MGTKTSCDYCDKVLDDRNDSIYIHIENKDSLILGIDVCSFECLERTLDLGSKILTYGCVPEKCYKKLIEETPVMPEREDEPPF